MCSVGSPLEGRTKRHSADRIVAFAEEGGIDAHGVRSPRDDTVGERAEGRTVTSHLRSIGEVGSIGLEEPMETLSPLLDLEGELFGPVTEALQDLIIDLVRHESIAEPAECTGCSQPSWCGGVASSVVDGAHGFSLLGMRWRAVDSEGAGGQSAPGVGDGRANGQHPASLVDMEVLDHATVDRDDAATLGFCLFEGGDDALCELDLGWLR